MKKRGLKTAFITGAMTLLMTTVSFASGWKQDNIGWWWQNPDGSYPVNKWEWLDGNADGISECYYFDETGYMLTNTTTPDGYQVNAEGAWISNGVVQTQKLDTSIPSSEANTTRPQIRHLDIDPKVENARWGRTTIMLEGDDFWAFRNNVAGTNAYLTTYDWIKAYADYSDKGAYWATVIDYFGVPYDLMDNLTVDYRTFDLVTKKGTSEFWLLEMTLEYLNWINIDKIKGNNFTGIKYDKEKDACVLMGGAVYSTSHDGWALTHTTEHVSYLN